MSLSAKQPYMNVVDYFKLDQHPHARYEYIDGSVTMLAGGTLNHNTICLNIATMLRAALRGTACRVYTSDVRVQLNEKRFVYPDVIVNCEDALGDATILTQPRLVVEVLSPGTESYDRGKKFDYYRECPSIQEYLLVNVEYPQVEVYRREKQTLWSFQAFQPDQDEELTRLGVRFSVTQIYEDIRFSGDV